MRQTAAQQKKCKQAIARTYNLLNDTGVFGSGTPAGDGCGPASRRRRRKYQRMNAANRAAPATPPTTAPAITPACDLCWFELGLEDAVGDGWDAVGVASGES